MPYKPTKKKQHYVPQLLLRNFSLFGKGEQIASFRVAGKKFLERTSIRDQAHQNHFYGEQCIEDELSKIEARIAPLIEAIRSQESIPTCLPDHRELLAFTLIQAARTPFAAAELKAIGEIHARMLALLGYAEEEREEINAPAIAMAATLNSLPLAEDLACALLCNRTKLPFVLADHPVLRHNQFLEDCGRLDGTTGLAARGLQMFLPISPEHTLLFFDADIYTPGPTLPPSGRIEVLEEGDVLALNLLQASNADECIYFNHLATEEAIRELADKAEPFRLNEKVITRSYKPEDPRAQEGHLTEVRRPDIKRGFALRSLTIADHAKWYNPGGGPIPFRNREAVIALEQARLAQFGLPPMDPGIYLPTSNWEGVSAPRKPKQR